jgi:formamidopyrimidine-DNA glycosylase
MQMPELPEVENVKLSLRKLLPLGSQFRFVKMNRADLRFPFPANLAEKLTGQRILKIERRAKFLVFETEKYWLLSHLGMSGSWREHDQFMIHDHLLLEFESGRKIVFNDPRRFGFVGLFDKATQPSYFENLGPEPLETQFDVEYLFKVSRGKSQPMKSFLLDQKIVAGLGNIYVCEALFCAQISPMRKASRLRRADCERLIPVIQKLLLNAIKAGGSTIRNYTNAEGKKGHFQNLFKVYGRDGENCPSCGKVIRIQKQAGRSTFWCSKCQR